MRLRSQGVKKRKSDGFQYRKRYEVTCDRPMRRWEHSGSHRFNTASGMRSHATTLSARTRRRRRKFQYRKRYEVTCDFVKEKANGKEEMFQYRKRYEVTCDVAIGIAVGVAIGVSIPQAV